MDLSAIHRIFTPPLRSRRSSRVLAQKPRPSQRLSVEVLENRTLLSASPAYTFAVIGDYGADQIGNSAQVRQVANLVLGWNPQDIITLGDNNYDDGGSDTIDQNIGQYFGSYMFPYHSTNPTYPTPSFGSNHFWPATGNHEYKNDSDPNDPTPKPFVDYFPWLTTDGSAATKANVPQTSNNFLNVVSAVSTPPDPNNPDTNGIYYTYGAGAANPEGGPLVQFFVLDTEIWVHDVQYLLANDPTIKALTGAAQDQAIEQKIEGTSQGKWLQSELASSTATWKIVTGHHPAYTNATSAQDVVWKDSNPQNNNYAGDNPWMQLPYKAWGADALLTGHVHAYNRIMGTDGFPYIVNGAGGATGPNFTVNGAGTNSPFPEKGTASYFPGSVVGAMLCTADSTSIEFKFMSTDGKSVDDYTLWKQNVASVTDNKLTVTGSNGHDVIRVLPVLKRGVQATVKGSAMNAVRVLVNGRTMGTFSGIDHISIYGLNGNDFIFANRVGISLTIDGGNGHDFIVGGRGSDVLIGGQGNDWLIGGRNDQMLGGGGKNRVIINQLAWAGWSVSWRQSFPSVSSKR